MRQTVHEPFTPETLAERLGKNLATLRRWRSRGLGPAWFRAAGRIVYSAEAVERWLQTRGRGPAYLRLGSAADLVRRRSADDFHLDVSKRGE